MTDDRANKQDIIYIYIYTVRNVTIIDRRPLCCDSKTVIDRPDGGTRVSARYTAAAAVRYIYVLYTVVVVVVIVIVLGTSIVQLK